MILSLRLLLTALAAICCAAVNGEQTNERQQYDLAAVKPTKAALLSSTAVPAAKDSMPDSFPIKMSATVEHPLQAEEARSLAVTGFITKDGNIYEVETAAGIGKIEARQASAEGQHICRYGSVVIYSDVPCAAMKSVQVRQMEETPAVEPMEPVEAMPVAAPLTENKPTEDKKEESNENTLNRPASSVQQQTIKPPTKPAQSLPNRPNQIRPNRPNQSRPSRPNQNRPNRPNQNRPNRPTQKPAQNRPIKPLQNRPMRPLRPIQTNLNRPTVNRPNRPNQNQPIQIVVLRPNKRPNQNNRNRSSNNNQITGRRVQPFYQPGWEEEEYDVDDDDEDDDEEQYFQGYNARYSQYYYPEYDFDY